MVILARYYAHRRSSTCTTPSFSRTPVKRPSLGKQGIVRNQQLGFNSRKVSLLEYKQCPKVCEMKSHQSNGKKIWVGMFLSFYFELLSVIAFSKTKLNCVVVADLQRQQVITDDNFRLRFKMFICSAIHIQESLSPLKQRRAQMKSRKFNPRRDSDKQTIPWATSLRATYGTTALENSYTRYSATNFAI